MSARQPGLPRDGDGRLTPAPPAGRIDDGPSFPAAARRELARPQQRRNLRHATHSIRDKRARAVAEVDDWHHLRETAARIKDEALHDLPAQLERLEESLTRNGATVHWARDAREATTIVADVVRATGAPEVVKVKSMLTQEIELNEALEEAGVAAWETDLAELIVQLGHDRPSHILVPAIHRNRGEVRDIFRSEMATYGRPAPEDLDDDPAHLAAAARAHLREKFLRAGVGISGANFAVAETGQLVVVESEGNGRMCLTLPRTLVSVVGIEKVLPRFEDLGVFLRLLARSSTAERMNPYTSIWSGVTPGDGPQDVHVVLVDNGRTNVLADPVGRDALRCIRCSACLNVCPVYEKVGGHAYGSVYPGPIGAILNPQLRGLDDPVDRALPFASTLCNACTDVCPVMIPIADILVHLRARSVESKHGRLPSPERTAMRAGGWVMGDHRRLEAAQRASSATGRGLGLVTDRIGPLPPPMSRWTDTRDVPLPPARTFRQWWADRERSRDAAQGQS